MTGDTGLTYEDLVGAEFFDRMPYVDEDVLHHLAAWLHRRGLQAPLPLDLDRRTYPTLPAGSCYAAAEALALVFPELSAVYDFLCLGGGLVEVVTAHAWNEHRGSELIVVDSTLPSLVERKGWRGFGEPRYAPSPRVRELVVAASRSGTSVAEAELLRLFETDHGRPAGA